MHNDHTVAKSEQMKNKKNKNKTCMQIKPQKCKNQRNHKKAKVHNKHEKTNAP